MDRTPQRPPARRRALITRGPLVALVDGLCATTTEDVDAVGRAPHGSGRIVLVTGGSGSGRTTALIAAAETCWAFGVTVHLALDADVEGRAGALVDEVLALPADRPVLLAIDDADTTRRALLERVADAADEFRRRRALVLAAVRPPEAAPNGASDALLRRIGAVGERLDVTPFDDAALGMLLAAADEQHGPVEPDLVTAVRDATGGIPRLVDAALDDRYAASPVEVVAGPPVDRLAVALADPTSRVRRVADAMLAGLDPEVHAAVVDAALFDGPFDPALPKAVFGAHMTESLSRALALGLLTLVSPADGAQDADTPVRLRFSAEALRLSALAHDAVGRPQRHVAIARTLLELPGRASDAPTALRHLRRAGEHAPRDVLREVAEAAWDQARTLGDLDGEVAALESLWEMSIDDPVRWRVLGSTLATVAVDAGRRPLAGMVARTVLRSFDARSGEMAADCRRALVAAALAATAGAEYLGQDEAAEAERMLMRAVARLGEDVDVVPLLCRAAELTSMQPHASALVRPFNLRGTDPAVADAEGAGTVPSPSSTTPVQRERWLRADREAHALIDRAEGLLAALAPDDVELRATIDVAWARTHLHDEFAGERWQRLRRSLPVLRGFDRAWAGTRLALDALSVGDRVSVERALLDASPALGDGSPLTSWRIATVRAMLLAASASLLAPSVTEVAATSGRRADEPMAELVIRVQRLMLSMEHQYDRPADAELFLPGAPELPPLVRAGRLELLARHVAERHAVAGAPDALSVGARTPDGERLTPSVRLIDDAAAMLDLFVAGGVNRGNLNLFLVLVARALFHLRHVDLAQLMLPDGTRGVTLVDRTAELLEPYGERVPTDVLGIVCYGSSARHLANLRALQGRYAEAEELAAGAAARDDALEFVRFGIESRIDAAVRGRLAHVATYGTTGTVPAHVPQAERASLLAVAADAERRGLVRLGREARLAAFPELHARLTAAQHQLLGDLAGELGFNAIAERRRYSPGTLRKMALPIYRALGVSRRTEAVELALESGLLPRLATGPGPSRIRPERISALV